MNIVFKKDIWPLMGYYDPSTDTIYITEGLSKFETASLIVHEWRHSFNTTEGLLKKEFESISASLFYPLIGTVIILFKTLFSLDRLRAYSKRIKINK